MSSDSSPIRVLVVDDHQLIRVGIATLLAGSPCAFALNPALDVSQYAHTAWKIREGFSKGKEDGTLWAATEGGSAD